MKISRLCLRPRLLPRGIPCTAAAIAAICLILTACGGGGSDSSSPSSPPPAPPQQVGTIQVVPALDRSLPASVAQRVVSIGSLASFVAPNQPVELIRYRGGLTNLAFALSASDDVLLMGFQEADGSLTLSVESTVRAAVRMSAYARIKSVANVTSQDFQNRSAVAPQFATAVALAANELTAGRSPLESRQFWDLADAAASQALDPTAGAVRPLLLPIDRLRSQDLGNLAGHPGRAVTLYDGASWKLRSSATVHLDIDYRAVDGASKGTVVLEPGFPSGTEARVQQPTTSVSFTIRAPKERNSFLALETSLGLLLGAVENDCGPPFKPEDVDFSALRRAVDTGDFRQVKDQLLEAMIRSIDAPRPERCASVSARGITGTQQRSRMSVLKILDRLLNVGRLTFLLSDWIYFNQPRERGVCVNARQLSANCVDRISFSGVKDSYAENRSFSVDVSYFAEDGRQLGVRPIDLVMNPLGAPAAEASLYKDENRVLIQTATASRSPFTFFLQDRATGRRSETVTVLVDRPVVRGDVTFNARNIEQSQTVRLVGEFYNRDIDAGVISFSSDGPISARMKVDGSLNITYPSAVDVRAEAGARVGDYILFGRRSLDDSIVLSIPVKVMPSTWTGEISKYEVCNAPDYRGAGNPCAYALQNVSGGGFWAGPIRISFQTGMTSPTSVIVATQGNFARAYSSAPVDLDRDGSFQIAIDHTGVFFSEPASSTVTFQVNERSTTSIRGTFSAQFIYPAHPVDPVTGLSRRAQGAVSGNWSAQLR